MLETVARDGLGKTRLADGRAAKKGRDEVWKVWEGG